MLTRLSLLTLAVIASIGTGTASARATNAVTLFDETVAFGLPGTVALPAPMHQARSSMSEGELVVESSLDIRLRFPGDVTGTMYLGTWQGEPAVVTRSGNHLDISVAHANGVDVTGFSGDSNESHHVQPLSLGRSDPSTSPVDAAEARSARVAHQNRAMETPRLASLPALMFWLFIHNDALEQSGEHIHASYVAWWIADMRRILPSRSLWLFYSQRLEGVTDVPYGTDSSLSDWTAALDTHAIRYGIPRKNREYDYKLMLFTKGEPAPGSTGQAWLKGNEAIASLQGRYTIVAHEFGHTLGAVHDDAEVRWSYGWPCETNLLADTSSFRANCYRYSQANERRMRAYLAREWTVPVNPHPPEIPLSARVPRRHANSRFHNRGIGD